MKGTLSQGDIKCEACTLYDAYERKLKKNPSRNRREKTETALY